MCLDEKALYRSHFVSITYRRLVAIDLLELHDMVRLGGSGDIPELSTPAEFYRKVNSAQLQFNAKYPFLTLLLNILCSLLRVLAM